MATYIIQAGPTGPVKIGRADDPADRLAKLQTGHPEELRIIRIVDTPFDSEAAFHERFAARRIRGEWFRFDAEMMTFIPPAPVDELPLPDIISAARKASLDEARALFDEIWLRFRGIETRQKFIKRIARAVGLTNAQAKKLFYGERKSVFCHEMEGLRAMARKLRSPEAKAMTPLPLFPDEEDGA